MGRSIGYYGIKMDGHEYSNGLIRDMAESWGDDLGAINQKTTLLLIAALAEHAAKFDDSEVDENLGEVLERIGELSSYDAICLIQALSN
jgi:hypothetical protein